MRKKREISQLFEIDVRRDVHKKPTQQLGAFLRLIGISLNNTGTRKENGKKVYEYRVGKKSLRRMEEVVATRTPENREQWRQERDTTTEGTLFTEEEKLKIPRTYKSSMYTPRPTPITVLEWDEVD